MSFPKTIEINGARVPWRELLRLRREQRKAARTSQPALFELKDDARPASQKTAAGRYSEPTLFEGDRR